MFLTYRLPPPLLHYNGTSYFISISNVYILLNIHGALNPCNSIDHSSLKGLRIQLPLKQGLRQLVSHFNPP